MDNLDRSNNAGNNFSHDPNRFGAGDTGAAGDARPSDSAYNNDTTRAERETGGDFQASRHNFESGQGGFGNTGLSGDTSNANIPGAGGDFGGTGRHGGYQQDTRTGDNNWDRSNAGPGAGTGSAGIGSDGTTRQNFDNQRVGGTGGDADRTGDFMNRDNQAGSAFNPDFSAGQGGTGPRDTNRSTGAGTGSAGIGGEGNTRQNYDNQRGAGAGGDADRTGDFMDRDNQAGSALNPDYSTGQGDTGSKDTKHSSGGVSMGDKVKGGLEKMAGRVAGKHDMVERGEERTRPDNAYDSTTSNSNTGY